MRRGTWSTARKVVVSLLMLAMMLVYAVPGHASLMPHHALQAPHEHGLVDPQDGDAAAVADHEHERDSCKDPGLLDDDACCSVAQCATMHGGLLADAVATFVPRLDMSVYRLVLATPEGIGSDPALRPPL